MSTRIFPLLAFAIWCFLCRNWYVCHIKERCASPVEMSRIPEQPIAQAPPAEPEPTQQTVAAEPTKEEAPAVAEPAPKSEPPAPKTEPKAATKSSTVEELSDRVVIHYDYNKLDKQANADVDDYLSRLAENLKSSGKTVTLVGHTDAVGDPKTNILVSERRAKNIRDILKEKGVAAHQIKTVGKGESQPVGSNDNPEGRRQNRRVEVVLGN